MRFRSTTGAFLLLILAATFVGLGFGQWSSYPAPAIPRLPDGKPNLGAPVPRVMDGKPDLSGLWQTEDLSPLGGIARNIAENLKSEDIQPWAQSVYQERLLSLGKDAPSGRCLPSSLLSLNSFPPTFAQIVQTPGVIVILYHGDQDLFRTIYTDGRELPKDPDPKWMGYSIGRWDGDTLVVNTAGFNDRAWLDYNGHPQTESLRVIERFRRRDLGHLELEMVLDDPKVFTKPVSVRINKVLEPDYAFPETVCENEKDAAHLMGGTGLRLSTNELSKFTGTYEFAPDRKATVVLAEGVLALQEGNGPKLVLIPQTETSFQLRDNGDGMEFLGEGTGTARQFVIHAAAGDRKAFRIDQGLERK